MDYICEYEFSKTGLLLVYQQPDFSLPSNNNELKKA